MLIYMMQYACTGHSRSLQCTLFGIKGYPSDLYINDKTSVKKYSPHQQLLMPGSSIVPRLAKCEWDVTVFYHMLNLSPHCTKRRVSKLL